MRSHLLILSYLIKPVTFTFNTECVVSTEGRVYLPLFIHAKDLAEMRGSVWELQYRLQLSP